MMIKIVITLGLLFGFSAYSAMSDEQKKLSRLTFENARSAAEFLNGANYRNGDIRGFVTKVMQRISRTEKLGAQEALLRVHAAIEILKVDETTSLRRKTSMSYLERAYEAIDWALLEQDYLKQPSVMHGSFHKRFSDEEYGGGGGGASAGKPSGRGWKDPSRMQAIQDRIDCFDDTLSTIKSSELQSGDYVSPSGNSHRISTKVPVTVIEDSSFAAWTKAPLLRKTQYSVVNGDTLNVALDVSRDSGHHDSIAVLDMANRNHPGGLPSEGAPAQEEQICYRSTLYPVLNRFAGGKSGFIPELGSLYVPSVTVFKGSEADKFPYLDDPFTVSIIASAAYRAEGHRRTDAPASFADYRDQTKEKIRSQLSMALMYNHEEIVLGAFGCGAFRNKPEDMARFYAAVLVEPRFKNQFTNVCFAIYEPKPPSGPRRGNLAIFKDEIEQLN